MSGKIELEEFVNHYVDTKNQLLIREIELKTSILDINRTLQSIQSELNIAKQSQKTSHQRQPSKLKIKVIQAENIGSNDEGALIRL
jgi:hypothetical protein